jgi:hypothetical protein
MVENNTYNNEQGGHKVTDYSQCAALVAGQGAGTVSASWTWTWPVATTVTTRATPSIIYGFKPWNPKSTTLNLPRKVDEVASLQVDAGTVAFLPTTDPLVDYDVISYLTASNVKAPGQTVLDIMGSVMVLWNEQGWTVGGTPAASDISIGGTSWDLYLSGSNLAYVPHGAIFGSPTSLHLDMADFLADGVGRGAIDPSWWVASVETAAIVYQGQGGFGLGDYKVTFQAVP